MTLPSSIYLTGTHFCGEYINNLKYKSHSPQHIDISRPIVKANCANIPKMTWQYQHWDLIWGGGRGARLVSQYTGYNYTAGSDRSPSASASASA